MGKGYLLGIDIGTYESKGVITDLNGKVLSTQVNPHTMSIPHQGWAEHDAEKDWWGDFCIITRKLLADTGIDPKEIIAVGCSAIGSDCLPVDKECKPLRMAILYGVDTRNMNEITELEEKWGKDKIFEHGGMELATQMVGPKILWVKKNEPEVYKKAYKFVTASTFLVARLTGNYVIDHMTGSFFMPMYDYKKGEWSREMSEGIVEVERLPELRWSDEIAGYVTKDAAAQTGLAEGTPVAVGAVDAVSECVSIGTVKPGQMMIMYGSTIIMLEVMDHYNVERTLWGQPYAFKGTYGMIGAMATSGALTRWFRDKVAVDLVAAEQAGGPNAYGELVKEAENIPAGSEGLVVLPYFSGERTPLNDPRARGTYFGLTLAHTRAHLFKATLEGVAFSIRHNFDVMKGVGATINEVIAVGGGTKNKIWLQAVSDICGVPQRIPDVVTGASYGDAFIAGLGAGVFSSRNDIEKWVKYSREVKPDPAKYDTYNQYFQVYLELYKRNKDLMHDLFHLANP